MHHQPQNDGDEELLDNPDPPTTLIFDEFKQCNSEYVLSDKDSESAISSDGEFIDAGKIDIYSEDDSHINNIEWTKENRALRE